jgi:cytochrome c biogenesis protein CcmG, thiol:disulfide interchange protein DsbE
MDMTRLRRPGPTLFVGLLLIACNLAVGSSRAADSTLNLDDYRGQVVLLDFWASWCVPCRRSFPWMNQMQQKYGEQGLVIIGVNMDASAEDADAFLREYPAQFTIISDRDGNLARRFEVEAMPSSYIIGRDGAVVATHMGFQVKKSGEYEEQIRQVLLSGEG